MSIIGLDFGSHTSSIALWYEDKDVVEVIADDLGSRTIPCYVGFRADEVIVGQSALAQFHKNHQNTFEDVRSMILDSNLAKVEVPILEKELAAQEIVSHYFRNIHNQIKQQVGKPVRDCVITIPMELDETSKQRLFEAAQAGGIRIKSILNDSVATLLAHNFDDKAIHSSAKVVIVDIGWSKTEVSAYFVSNGLFSALGRSTTTEMSGKVMTYHLAEHCAKDFQRKSKVMCSDNKKSMMRLRKECEETIKQLSTGQEATIDIDSLCEGIDYSTKITRAKFEDLSSAFFIHLKNTVYDVITKSNLNVDDVTHVCLTGGISAIPRVISIMKTLFPSSTFPKSRFETTETHCIGSVLHGKYLIQQGLIENIPTQLPNVSALSQPLLISSGAKEEIITLFPVNSVPPLSKTISAKISNKGFFGVYFGSVQEEFCLGEVVVDAPEDVKLVDIVVNLKEESIEIEVKHQDTSISSLVIPTSK